MQGGVFVGGEQKILFGGGEVAEDLKVLAFEEEGFVEADDDICDFYDDFLFGGGVLGGGGGEFGGEEEFAGCVLFDFDV